MNLSHAPYNQPSRMGSNNLQGPPSNSYQPGKGQGNMKQNYNNYGLPGYNQHQNIQGYSQPPPGYIQSKNIPGYNQPQTNNYF